MHHTARSTLALTLAAALTLTGCAAGGASAPAANTEGTAAAAEPPTTPPVAQPPADALAAGVDPSDLPEWFPHDLPMPAGTYRWAVADENGLTLEFFVPHEDAILDLLRRLDEQGYIEYALDVRSEASKTWFTQSDRFRVNIAAHDLGTPEADIIYRIEPKDA